MNTPKLKGDRSLCAACGLPFTTSANFAKHRTGDYTSRRCLTADELTAKGWAPNAAGFWRKPMTDAQRERALAALSAT